MEKIKELIKKFCTREVILYLIFGVLTTLVNFVSFYVLNKLVGWEENLSNFIAGRAGTVNATNTPAIVG